MGAHRKDPSRILRELVPFFLLRKGSWVGASFTFVCPWFFFTLFVLSLTPLGSPCSPPRPCIPHGRTHLSHLCIITIVPARCKGPSTYWMNAVCLWSFGCQFLQKNSLCHFSFMRNRSNLYWRFSLSLSFYKHLCNKLSINSYHFVIKWIGWKSCHLLQSYLHPNTT